MKMRAIERKRVVIGLTGSFGTGIRPPDGFELAFTTKPELKPEKSISFDAGMEHSTLELNALLEQIRRTLNNS